MMRNFRNDATFMRCKQIKTIVGGQDGAIYDNVIFRFDSKGMCSVIDFHEGILLDTFYLDKLECITPHSNTVCFSNTKYERNDRFPLLYINVYNNYADSENRREGECCVYRIIEKENKFFSILLQIIKVGFVNSELWRSKNIADIRPYGNFLIDKKRNRLIVLTMRDEDKTTRIFEFSLPSVVSGTYCEKYDVKFLELNETDILAKYDIEYTRFMQGAVCYDDYLYVSEGFCNDKVNVPAIRVINVMRQKSVGYYDLTKIGLSEEPELVEVYQGNLYYSDAEGRFFIVEFVER